MPARIISMAAPASFANMQLSARRMKAVYGMLTGMAMYGNIAYAEPIGSLTEPPVGNVPVVASAHSADNEDVQQDAAKTHLTRVSGIMELLLSQGYYWLGQHNLGKAQETIERALSIEPDNNEALLLLGRLQMAQGSQAQAVNTLSKLIHNGGPVGLVNDLKAQIQAGPVDPKALAEARALAASGKMMPAMFKYKALFKNGDPPPDLAMEYYRVLGATILGYQEARTKLAAWIARNPRDVDAKLTFYRILTYRVTSRAEGLDGLRQLARSNIPAPIRESAVAAWREALLWEPITGPTIPLYNEWLGIHHDDCLLYTSPSPRD